MEKSEIEKKIRELVDYVHSPKHQNSLNKVLAKTEKVLENITIGRLLMISETEVEALYQQAVEVFRKEMVKNEGEDS